MSYSRIVESIPSLVPFVAPEEIEKQLGVKFVLRLGANESSFGPSPSAVLAASLAAENSNNYGDPKSSRLVSSLSELLSVDESELVVASGIDELLMLFCRLFLNPGDLAVCTMGTYPTFEFAALGAGAELMRIPYKDDKPDLMALSAASQTAKVVYLANPDNPSGWMHDSASVRDFVRTLPSECILLLDEAYGDYFAPELLPYADVKERNVIRLWTFSKIYGLAGLRIGYAISDPEHILELNKIRLHFGVNRIAQAAAEAALADHVHLLWVREQNEIGRARLHQMGVERGLKPLPSSTNFVTFDCGSRDNAETTLKRLLDQRVFIRKPGIAPLDRCIRITIGSEEQLNLLDHLWTS